MTAERRDTALSGKATLHIAGVEHLLESGVFALVGPAEKRKITTGTERAQLLYVGGAPGKAYEPLSIVEPGGPTGSNPAADTPQHTGAGATRPPAHIGRWLVPFRAQTPIRPPQAQ